MHIIKKDVSLISDSEYDGLCKTLLAEFDDIHHKYKFMVSREDFDAGTGFNLRYPAPLERALNNYLPYLIKEHNV